MVLLSSNSLCHCSFLDLEKNEYTFGRGEMCDYQFNTPAMIKHPCFQAYSKIHFKLLKVINA